MTDSQKLQLQLSELRTKINGFAQDGDTAELDAMTGEYSKLESRYRAAIITETADEKPSGNDHTPEGRELTRLVGRTSIDDYIRESITGTAAEGAAKELREATMGGDERGYMPLDLLEYRVDAVTAFGGASDAATDRQQPIAERVFAASATAFLGVGMPAVQPGNAKFPRISAGTGADVRDDGVELDGTAAVITVEEIEPVRLTASYTFNERDELLVEGLANAFAADLRATIGDKLDSLAINGQAVSANVSPAVAGIINSYTAPPDPAAAEAAPTSVRSALAAAVDGIYAQDSGQIRTLINVVTNVALQAWSDTAGQPIATSTIIRNEYLRVSANMPAEAANISTAITYAAGARARGLVMPVWRGIRLIDDRITLAKSGRRILTAVQYVGWKMVDSSPYKLYAVRT